LTTPSKPRRKKGRKATSAPIVRTTPVGGSNRFGALLGTDGNEGILNGTGKVPRGSTPTRDSGATVNVETTTITTPEGSAAGRFSWPKFCWRFALLMAGSLSVRCDQTPVHAGKGVCATPCSSDFSLWKNATVQAVLQHIRGTRRARRDVAARKRHFDSACKHVKCTFLSNGMRDQIMPMLMNLGYSGQSAEVGVWHGRMSMTIMKKLHGWGRHYVVDPYRHFDAACDLSQTKARLKGDKQCRFSQRKFDLVFNMTSSALLSKFPTRAVIMRNFSVEAANALPNESLSFVYVDARHDYDGVLEDLRAWWPKLCPGAIFSGHDYSQEGLTTGRPSRLPVALAVHDFVQDLGEPQSREVFITAEHPASWLLFKAPRRCTQGEMPLIGS